jgi:hypothetical protein
VTDKGSFQSDREGKSGKCGGIYQHCGKKHLHRYLAEYDFRYNYRVKLGFNDTDLAAIAVKQASGERLTYRKPH